MPALTRRVVVDGRAYDAAVCPVRTAAGATARKRAGTLLGSGVIALRHGANGLPKVGAHHAVRRLAGTRGRAGR